MWGNYVKYTLKSKQFLKSLFVSILSNFYANLKSIFCQNAIMKSVFFWKLVWPPSILNNVKNIARIAKAARHKLPGKSSLNVSSVLSCPLHHVYHHDQVIDHSDHDDHYHHHLVYHHHHLEHGGGGQHFHPRLGVRSEERPWPDQTMDINRSN